MVGCLREQATKNEVYICFRSICLRCVCVCERALRLSLSTEVHESSSSSSSSIFLLLLSIYTAFGLWILRVSSIQDHSKYSVACLHFAQIIVCDFVLSKQQFQRFYIVSIPLPNHIITTWYCAHKPRSPIHFRGQQPLSAFSCFPHYCYITKSKFELPSILMSSHWGAGNTTKIN